MSVLWRRRVAGSAVVALVLGFVSCDKNPIRPSPGPAATTFVRLDVIAPEEIAPSESVQLVANAYKSDGSVETITERALWTIQSFPDGSVGVAMTEGGSRPERILDAV